MRYIFLVYLLVSTIVDIRTQKLPSVWIYSGLIGMGSYAFWQIIARDRTTMELVYALIPGVLCYVFAKISRAMGVGDALLIFGMGFGFPLFTVTGILMLSLFLAAVGSIVILLINRRMKNRRVPFVPYLFLASGFILTG